MIGPTGCGKTEIARRLARLAEAPFLKVEATKFTEVGYVGRDVEQIARDLVEIAISMTRERLRKQVEAKAERRRRGARARRAGRRPTPAPTPARNSARCCARARSTTARSRSRCRRAPPPSLPTFEIPGMPGAQMGMLNLGDIFGKAFGGAPKTKKMTVAESHRVLMAEESDKLLDQERRRARGDPVGRAERHRLSRRDRQDLRPQRARRRLSGADVSREGVQRDLLPLIEGTTVATKHGAVKTDHILFIASGAFHLAKPSDLLPELQGRLPIRVELKALDRADLRRILTEPEASLIKQYRALLATEGIDLDFRPMRSTRSRSGRADQRARSRISARAGCTRSSSGCWRRSASPPPTSRTARLSRSTPAMSASGSARWRRTPICRGSFCNSPRIAALLTFIVFNLP